VCWAVAMVFLPVRTVYWWRVLGVWRLAWCFALLDTVPAGRVWRALDRLGRY